MSFTTGAVSPQLAVDPERKITFEYHKDGLCEVPTGVTDQLLAGEIRIRTNELFA